MGRVEFGAGVTVPQTARTGQLLECKIPVKNVDTEPLTYVHCKVVGVVAYDREGRQVYGKGEAEFDAWTYMDYTITLTFVMPYYDVYVGFELWQVVEDRWVLVDSTAYLLVDNPDWPPVWMQNICIPGTNLCMPLWQWLVVGMVGFGVAVVVWKSIRK